MTDRTRLINQARGFLTERGIWIGTGRHVFQKELTRLAADGNDDLSRRMLMLLSDMASELDVINDRVAIIDTETKALAKTDADMQRLMEIPGIGPTIATANGWQSSSSHFCPSAKSPIGSYFDQPISRRRESIFGGGVSGGSSSGIANHSKVTSSIADYLIRQGFSAQRF